MALQWNVLFPSNPPPCKVWGCSGMDMCAEPNSIICAGSALNRLDLRKGESERWNKPCLKRKNLPKKNSPLNELRRGGGQFTGKTVDFLLCHTAWAQSQCRTGRMGALRP